MTAGGTVLRRLAEACDSVVCVVHGDDALEPEEVRAGGGPAATLDRLVEAAPGYGWSTVRGRHVVFPTEAVWRERIDVRLGGPLPRAEAADALCGHLRRRFRRLQDLTGVLVKGDPRAPVLATLIEVEGEDEVVGHLVALVEDDPSLAFSIERAGSGARVLLFEPVGGVA